MNIKKLKEMRKNKKGFTLIEIIVVIVILAVLMAVAVPSVLNYINEADNAKFEAQARAVMNSAQTETVKELVTADGITTAELATVKNNIISKCGVADVTDIKLYKETGSITGEGTDSLAYSGTELAGGETKADVTDLVAVSMKIGDMKAVVVLNDKVYLGEN